jgi:UDP-glucuronate 4-epimerase
MKILVTGGAGFIGSHFIERLLAQVPGAEIVCLDDFNSYYDPALKRANVARFAGDRRVTVIGQSLCNPDVVSRLFAENRFSHVMHLGAAAGVRASIAEPLGFEETNVRGTLVLLEAARVYAVERFVLVSSSTVYGQGASVPFQEDAPLGTPLSPYGATKRAAELLGLVYLRLHQVPVVMLRPFSVYGPRIRPDLAMWAFSEAILAGRPVTVFGDGSVCRDFTHVSDVCAGLIASLEAKNVVGEAINLGHSEPVTIRELLGMLEAALGRKCEIDAQSPVAGDMPVTCADLSKAERLLGYRPQVSLVDGVREFAEWFRGTPRT